MTHTTHQNLYPKPLEIIAAEVRRFASGYELTHDPATGFHCIEWQTQPPPPLVPIPEKYVRKIIPVRGSRFIVLDTIATANSWTCLDIEEEDCYKIEEITEQELDEALALMAASILGLP